MKIPGYEGKRFFLVGQAKYPGRCSVSGITAGVSELWLLRDQKEDKLRVVHQQYLLDHCLKNDPNRQVALPLDTVSKEEKLANLAKLQQIIAERSKK